MNDTPKQNWWQRLSGGLKRTSASIGGAISDLVSKRKLDAATLEELEELLIRADLGVDVSARIAAAIGEGRYDKQVSDAEVKSILAAEVDQLKIWGNRTGATVIAREQGSDAASLAFEALTAARSDAADVLIVD